ncbi:hypothetical protein [uncultured Serinicoccus sp.]|uniref:hypothetical protein n=1 Tax=uncultured Serinicoccus sp. TaxID=735514 RepID=UPI00260202A9|nr:hypothetical protein [uncultured Serinicoccus sp.]
MSTTTPEVVQHLIANTNTGLVPYCGTLPGRDEVTGDRHAGHDRDLLLNAVGFGLPGCITCLSPEALGGWTPLILEEISDEE